MGRFYGPRAHRLKYALPQSTPPPRTASAFGTEMVLDVRHWTDDYFRFTTTRDDGFRFDNAQSVMIGLAVDRRPLLRAYSIASATWDEQLELLDRKSTRLNSSH